MDVKTISTQGLKDSLMALEQQIKDANARRVTRINLSETNYRIQLIKAELETRTDEQ